MPDGRSGRGATYWWSGQQNTTEQVVIEFDRPERVSRLIYDVEELRAERTQPVTMEPSTDGGETYRAGFVQEYTFSANGSTYQRENLSFDLHGVTHMRFIVVPARVERVQPTSLRCASSAERARLAPARGYAQRRSGRAANPSTSALRMPALQIRARSAAPEAPHGQMHRR
jgi:hypothetical protein